MEGFFGIYRGIVTNDNDPEGLLRVKALVPQVFGSPTIETDWAWPLFTPGADLHAPLPTSGVWVSFEGGDTDHPLWVGVWSNAETVPLPTGTGTLTGITSVDHSVAITNPEGPVPDLSVQTGGGGILDQVVVIGFNTPCGPSESVAVNPDGILPIIENGALTGSNPFKIRFVAPTSGSVELWAEMEFDIETFNPPSGVAWCFADGATGTVPVSWLQQVQVYNNEFGDVAIDTTTRGVYHAYVYSLAPGDTYNWQLSGFQLSGTAAADILANDGTDPSNPFGPAVLTVRAV